MSDWWRILEMEKLRRELTTALKKGLFPEVILVLEGRLAEVELKLAQMRITSKTPAERRSPAGKV